MADRRKSLDLQKGSKISVTVVEALVDVIVVSLDFNSKVYQGALLDITNRSIKPFCTSPFSKADESAVEDEPMFALKMRHTYVASSRENEAPSNGGLKSGAGVKDKRARKVDQHVRMRKLRPRKTLCSNCQNKCEDMTSTSRASAKKNTAPLVSVIRGNEQRKFDQPTASGSEPALATPSQMSPSPWTEETPQTDVYASVAENALIKEELPSSAQMPEPEKEHAALRKRKVMDDNGKATKHDSSLLPAISPIIKISFNNPQGKGTVVKIPAKVAVANYEETTSDEGDREGNQDDQPKAMKRRRREVSAVPGNSETNKHHKRKTAKHKKKRHKNPSQDSCDSDGEEPMPIFPKAAVDVQGGVTQRTTRSSDETMKTGDVVWGKVMGFPWWPGKILSLGCEASSNELQSGEAHVSWFGSSTSSRILTSHLTPFLRDFKLRYNRRKRGPYKDAIRQAQQEAKARKMSL
ncbi:PWWP domain-containing protein 2A [Galendromus occidentalis]|uniref:PWWP domain-containing protein 2A n=1 Tax=Galendromus occidentalis TaxID=34638 RepID=A0AAJ6QPM7_9ACAR|nr:PWWP domain-containing protein 2A [Galendromus occidentalis]